MEKSVKIIPKGWSNMGKSVKIIPKEWCNTTKSQNNTFYSTDITPSRGKYYSNTLFTHIDRQPLAVYCSMMVNSMITAISVKGGQTCLVKID